MNTSIVPGERPDRGAYSPQQITRQADAREWLAELFPAAVLSEDCSASIRLALLDRSADGTDRRGGWDELPGFRPGVQPFADATHDELLDALAASIVATSDRGLDVFAAVYPHGIRRSRRKGAASSRRHVHADVDGPLDMHAVQALGAFAVASGSTSPDGEPHGHAYLRLSRSIEAYEHEAVCRAFGARVGGDAHDTSKVADDNVLRPVGSLNHKRGAASPVEWLVRPNAQYVRTWEPEVLARLLGCGWPIADPAAPALAEGDGIDGIVRDRLDGIRSDDDATGERMTPRRADALVQRVVDAPSGEGNGVLLWAACRVIESDVESAVEHALLDRLAEAFAARPSNEPHARRMREARATIASARSRAHDGTVGHGRHELPTVELPLLDVDLRGLDAGDLSGEAPVDPANGDAVTVTTDAAPTGAVAADAVRTKFPRLDLAVILDPNRPPRRWLLDDTVPEGDHVSIVAPAGVGKSLLVLALSVAALRREPDFIGRALTSPERVLYVDMENTVDDWSERLSDLGVTPDEAAGWGERFIPLSFPPLAGGLDTKRGSDDLRAILDAYGVTARDLLVLDSTQRLTDGDENSNDTIRQLYNLTSAELKRRGITVIRTDNTGHEGDRARGASAKRDDVAMSWILTKVDGTDDCFTLRPTKRRAAGSSDGLTFQRVTGPDDVLRFITTNGPASTNPYDLARDALDVAAVTHTLGLEAAWKAVRALPDYEQRKAAGLTRKRVQSTQHTRKLVAEAVIVGALD